MLKNPKHVKAQICKDYQLDITPQRLGQLFDIYSQPDPTEQEMPWGRVGKEEAAELDGDHADREHRAVQDLREVRHGW